MHRGLDIQRLYSDVRPWQKLLGESLFFPGLPNRLFLVDKDGKRPPPAEARGAGAAPWILGDSIDSPMFSGDHQSP